MVAEGKDYGILWQILPTGLGDGSLSGWSANLEPYVVCGLSFCVLYPAASRLRHFQDQNLQNIQKLACSTAFESIAIDLAVYSIHDLLFSFFHSVSRAAEPAG